MTNETHPNSTGHGSYERRDVSVAGVVYFLVGLAVSVGLVYLLANGVYQYLDKRFESQQTPVSPLVANAPTDTRRIPPQYNGDYEKYLKDAFPSPQLEVNERTELNAARLREEDTLNTYDWVDKNAGTVRIPIERAMELVAQRGLPVRTQDDMAGTAPQPQQQKKGSK